MSHPPFVAGRVNVSSVEGTFPIARYAWTVEERVPLSEHEQRLLDQIERALYAEDPKFASTVRSTDLKSHLLRRIKRAVVMLVLGLVTLVVGAASSVLPLGVAGFLVMLGAGLVIGRSAARISGGAETGGARVRSPRRTKRDSRSSWRERIQERWNRRWEDRD